MLLYSDLVNEVKHLAVRDQGGTTFDSQIKNGINESLLYIARETHWTKLRRYDSFNTVTSYTTGTGAVAVTNGSVTVTVTGALFITNNIFVGRRITLGGSSKRYTIVSITGETTLTVDIAYDGTTSSTQSYQIWPQEEYTLPVQCEKVGFLWHEAFAYPLIMQYMPSQQFYESSTTNFYSAVPLYYKTWIENMVLRQPNSASIVTVVSSSTADTALGQTVTIFGLVAGYPDQETLTLNGTTSVNGAKSFSKIDRVVKNASTTGRVTATTNSAAVTVAVIPTGAGTLGVFYKTVRLWPLPSFAFPMQVWYYKQPWFLVNDQDIHELGQEFDHAIILLTTAKIRYQNNQSEGDRFMSMYNEEIRSLRKTNGDKLDWINTLRRPEDSRFDSLGVNRNLSYGQLGGAYGSQSFR